MRDALRTFAAAVAWGAIASGAPFLILGPVAMVVMIVASIIVCGSLIVVGLPATLILYHLRKETARAYQFLGAVAGTLLPSVLLDLEWGLEWVIWTLPGIIGGTVTATIWGRWRESRSRMGAGQPG